MEKKILLLILICASILLVSNELQISNLNGNIIISGSPADFEITENPDNEYLEIRIKNCSSNGIIGNPELPKYTQLVNLPDNGNYSVKEIDYDFEEISLDKEIIFSGWEDNEEPNQEIYEANRWIPEEIVFIGDPVIMRGIRFSQVSVATVQYNPALNKLRLLKNINIKFEIDHSIRKNPLKNNRSISTSTFNKIASAKIFGIEPDRSENWGTYLFICPDNCVSTLQPLARWKEKLGFKAKIVPKSEAGSTYDQIKNYLQNAYDNWEIPPEYVVLVGDVDGSFIIPADYIDGYYTPWDVTDHSYALLEGDDYFPDVMIGRLSIRTTQHLQTIINKIISYESNPETTTDWFTKAIMLSVVMEGWYEYYSGRETVMAVREKLLDFTYTLVDTFISPYQSNPNYIDNFINNGCTFVNYRGFGGPAYWSSSWGSMYGISDVQSLNNGFKLPMVTGIVCGGGDFANNDYPSCFGETWLNSGSPALPKGAIGFIGPSEIDTKTPFNNANDIGIYQGITQEELFRCGEMLLRGKMELYINYPNCHNMDGYNDANDSDQFYFYVYNLLGDPGLSVWTDVPQNVDISFESLITNGDNFLNIGITSNIESRADFVIAVTNDDSLVARRITDAFGSVNIPLSLEIGEYSVTASKYGYIPKTEDLIVEDGNIVCLNNFAFLNEPYSGSLIDLEITLKNIAESNAENVDLELVSNDEFIEIISGAFSVDEMIPEETTTTQFQFQIGDEWLDGVIKELFLNVSSNLGDDTFLIPVEIISPEMILSEFIVANFDGVLIQNQTDEVYIQLLNGGNQESGDLSVTLECSNGKAMINSANSSYPNIGIDSSVLCDIPFEITPNDVITGEQATFDLEISNDGNVVQILTFSIPIGIVGQDSPTFSDYGYIAIESSDVGNFEAPVYNWIEICPYNGGSGTMLDSDHGTTDGYVGIVDLPFMFQYYGKQHNQVSIASNGYLSMGECEQIFFRNRTIPSGIGPNSMIAPFWDFIKNGDLSHYYDESEHIFIIEWDDFMNQYSYQEETFQVILYDPEFYPTQTGDGQILFQYKEINNVDAGENYATVGIENEDQDEGILLSYANYYHETAHTLQDHSAILFIPFEEPEVGIEDNEISEQNVLYGNYPNPFNSSTTISFNLTTELTENTEIIIYNIKGQKVKVLECINSFNAKATDTLSKIVWDGTDESGKQVNSGIYFYKLGNEGKFTSVKKMILLR